MNREEAIQLDKDSGVEVSYTPGDFYFYVIGINSGYVYDSLSYEDDAEEESRRLNQILL